MVSKFQKNLAKSRAAAALMALVAGGFAFAAAGESVNFHNTGTIIEFTGAEKSWPDGENGDLVLKFTDTETPGTLKLPGYATAWVLSIGGGGAGGTGQQNASSAGVGGGGGAGGFVELKNQTLQQATYTIEVGKGGGGGSDKVLSSGENGNPSHIYLTTDDVDMQEIEAFTAYGGGGGGAESAGKAGASGGGGSMQSSSSCGGGLAIHGNQGNPGGAGEVNKAGAGGGGAGASALNAGTLPRKSKTKSSGYGSEGGDGRPSKITLSLSATDDEAVYYAGGGGGGVASGDDKMGFGGKGNGLDGNAEEFGKGGGGLGGKTAPIQGADGFGGGGGGGTQATAGASGGSGVVIIRISEAMVGGPQRPKTPVSFPYTGEGIQGVPSSLGYTISGDLCKTNVGDYTSTVTLKEGFEWQGGGKEKITVKWSITPKPVSYPDSAEFTYDGEMKFAFTSLPEGIEYVSGKTNETEATDTDYVYTVKLANDNYVWKDAGEGKEHDPYDVHWFLHPKAIDRPVKAKLTYNGKEQFVLSKVDPAIEFVWTGEDNNRTNAVNADTYYYVIKPKNSNYVWKDATEGHERDELTESWDIDPKPVLPPPCTSNLVYNGEAQCSIDTSKMDYDAYDFTGDSEYEKEDAGTYLYTLRLNNTGEFQNYIWGLEPTPTFADQKFPWVIRQDTNYVSKLVLDGWKVGSPPYKPTVEVKWGTPVIKYAEREDTPDSEWVEDPPTEEGTWWVWAHVDETKNWMKADARKQFALWNDPDQIFSDHVVITVKNAANKDFADYPLTITLNDNVPPGFTYERAGADGRDLVFISADGTKQLPYTIVNWNIAGDSKLTVYLDTLPKAGTTVSLYWALKEGKTTPAQPTKPEHPSTPSTYVTSTYGTVERDGKKVDSWKPAPTMTPTQWDEGSAPTIKLNAYAVVSGAPVSAGYYNVYDPTVTNVFDAAAVAALPSGSYLAVFTAQKDETWLPIDYEIQFRVVGHSPTIGLGDTSSGRVLLMNNDKGDDNHPAVTYQGVGDSDETYYIPPARTKTPYSEESAKRSDTPTFWHFIGDDRYEDNTYNRKAGTNCVLWTRNYGKRLWHLTNCRHGNTYNQGDNAQATGTPTMNANQNYLPWASSARRISQYQDYKPSHSAARAMEVGQILMQNTTNACIYSPCYTNGVGTIYFDAVNGWRSSLSDFPNAYQIVVEVATETKDGSPLTEESSHVTTNAVGLAVTNDYSNIKEWKPVLMYPVHYKDGTLTPTNATTKFSLAVKTGGTKSDFYRFHVPINHRPTPENPGGLRFRIRRAGYDPEIYGKVDALAYLLVDNVLVSYPPMTATLHGLGWIDPAKENEQTLGWENVTTVAFPSQYEKEAYGRARSTYYVNDGASTAGKEHWIVSAKMWYRWRYLNQLGGGAFDSVDLNPGRLDYRSMQPLKFPGGVGDVEYWFETRFQAPYYEFQDYSGLNLGGAALKEATGFTEEVTCTTNRHVATTRQSSAGTDWFFRLREGKSKFEGMQICTVSANEDGSHTVVYTPMELVGDGSWRGFLKTPAERKEMHFHIEGLNPQGANMGEFNWSTNYWKAVADITDLPRTTKGEACQIQDWSAVPCDARTGYLIFSFEESTLGLSVARADYQSFNRWTTAVGPTFVGSEVERVYSSSTVGETNLNWSAWPVSVAVNDDWAESFDVSPGERADKVYPKNRPFNSARTTRGWLAENAMWVHGQWQHETWSADGKEITTLGDDSAVQLEGRGKGRLTFASATSAPKGLDTVKATMRLAQFNDFNNFTYWNNATIEYDAADNPYIAFAEDMTDYTFVTMANISERSGNDYKGDGTLSLVACYTVEEGCYEVRFSRGSKDTNIRMRLLKWYSDGTHMTCKDLGFKEVNDKFRQFNTESTTKSLGGLFISVEPSGGGTLVQAGFMATKKMSTDGSVQSLSGEAVCAIAYLDTSSTKLTHGTFGLLSANCYGTFVKPAYYTKGAGKIGGVEVKTANTLTAIGFDATGKSSDSAKIVMTGKFVDDGASTNFDPYYKKWKKPPGRLSPMRYSSGVRSSMVGFETLAGFSNKVVLEIATHGGSDWRGVYTNTVSSFLDEKYVSVVHSPKECDIRYLVLGDPNDVRTDVVINDVELSQWCGEETPGLDNSGSYARMTDFVYTGAWVEKDKLLSLQPARAATPDTPISMRAPLLKGTGLFHFEWRNADSRTKLRLQIAENEDYDTLCSLMRGLTRAPADGADWKDLAVWTRDDLKPYEDALGRGKMNVYVNHRAPLCGVMRLVIDKSVVAGALADPGMDPNYGLIQISGAYVWDLPAYSPRDWSGWNMRAEGWENDAPTKFANIADSPRGYSGILNNTLDPSSLKDKDADHYKLNPPNVQSPTFGTNCIGEVLFKARLHDVPQKGNPSVVTLYGSNSIDEETGEPLNWEEIGDVEVKATTFATYSLKFKTSQSFRAVRFAVKGVDGVVSAGDPLYDPPARVVLDSLCVLEQAVPGVRFRNFHVRPFRDSNYMKNTKALPEGMITSADQQPILGEAFGFQAELQLDVNEKDDIRTDDPKHPISVELYYYQAKEPWGYENWKDLRDAHRVTLVAADGTNLVFRSTMARPDTLARPVFQKDVGPYGFTQYHLVAHFYDKAGEHLTHDLTAKEWTIPEWYEGLADPNKERGAKFSAFTLLEPLSPGRAWINEINYCEASKKTSLGRQFVELAVPQQVDMTGWEVYLYSLDSALSIKGSRYVGEGPLVRLGKGDCKTALVKEGDPVSHYAFLSVAAPTATDLPQAPDGKGHVDGRWNKIGDGYYVGDGKLAYTDPYGLELRRPSGIIEHRVVVEGDYEQYADYWYGYQYTATNLAEVLTETVGGNWVVAGHDLPQDGWGVSVTNNQGRIPADWSYWPLTTGEKNRNGDREQWIDPSFLTTPNGDYVWLYLGCLDPQIRMIFGDETSQSEVVTVLAGGGTNITYEVENFYELDKQAFEAGFTSEHAEHRWLREWRTADHKTRYELQIYDVSNRVDSAATSMVAKDVQARGVTPDNPYKPAIMKWLKEGFTRDRNGNKVWFQGDTVQDFVYRYSHGSTPTEETTNLSLKVAYWLDVDPTQPGWELMGNMGAYVPGALGQEAGSYVCRRARADGTTAVHTNRFATMWMELTNTVTGVAHPPWRLQGLGNERSDDPATYAQGWTSVTFKVTGQLLDGGVPKTARKRPLRYFVFDPNSFRDQNDDVSPFSARVEVVDPFSRQSPAFDWNWGPWWRLTVGLSWGLDDDLTPVGVSTMRFDDTVDENWTRDN